MKRTKSSANKPESLQGVTTMTATQRNYLIKRVDEIATKQARKYNEATRTTRDNADAARRKLIDAWMDELSDAQLLNAIKRKLRTLGASDPDSHKYYRQTMIRTTYPQESIVLMSGAAKVPDPEYIYNTSDMPELLALKDEIMLGASVTSLSDVAERIEAIFRSKAVAGQRNQHT